MITEKYLLGHSAAMELLQSSVDCSVIALWLGHESIETTQSYPHAHLALKEVAPAKLRPYERSKRPASGNATAYWLFLRRCRGHRLCGPELECCPPHRLCVPGTINLCDRQSYGSKSGTRKLRDSDTPSARPKEVKRKDLHIGCRSTGLCLTPQIDEV